MSRIDHLVYATNDLHHTVHDMEKKMGITISPGGRHLDFGTHNALVNLGEGIYLEIIAPDPDNHQFKGPLWMGLDHLDESPRLTRYGLKKKIIIDDLDLLSSVRKELSRVSQGRRQKPDGSTLEWTLTVPHSDPLIETCPFLIDWSESVHPTLSLPQECQLKSFTIFSPDDGSVRHINQRLGADIKVIYSEEPRLEAIIQCPTGDITIS
jgi:hypothetical protein